MDNEGYPIWEPAVFTWNADEAQYVILVEETVEDEQPEESIQIWLFDGYFEDQRYQDLLDLSAEDLSHFSEQELFAVRYYRALALEALNRPDEALAEYVAIYESAPESAWGMLAALHLERVE